MKRVKVTGIRGGRVR